MEFAVQVDGSYESAVIGAQWAERIGLAAFARSDHYFYRRPTGETVGLLDTLSVMAGLARETSAIELVVLVSPITFRHPAVLAKQAVTIDHLSGGRFTLGLGTGWLPEEHQLLGIDFPPWPERWERLEEALQYLRAVLGKGPPGFEGTYYRVADEVIEPTPVGNLKLLLGGFGPTKTPELSGRLADEYNVALIFPMDDLPARVATARRAATAAGRTEKDLLISAMGPAIVARDDATYGRRLEEAAAHRDMDRQALEDSFRDCLLPCGTAKQVADHMAMLKEAGISRYYLQKIGAWDEGLFEETIELLAQ